MGLGIFEDRSDSSDEEKRIRFIYKNYKGEVSERQVVPCGLYYDKNNGWHDSAWILEAYDLDKGAVREFCLTDIIEFIET